MNPSWITEASIVVSLHPSIIPLIIPFFDFEIGIFAITLYRDSQPISIVISNAYDIPIFAQHSSENEWILPLVEKAFAKLSGAGYDGLAFFKPGTAWGYLVDGTIEEFYAPHDLFLNLRQVLHQGSLLSISPSGLYAYHTSSISIEQILDPILRLENMRRVRMCIVKLYAENPASFSFLEPVFSEDWQLLSRRKLRKLGLEDTENTRYIPFKVSLVRFLISSSCLIYALHRSLKSYKFSSLAHSTDGLDLDQIVCVNDQYIISAMTDAYILVSLDIDGGYFLLRVEMNRTYRITNASKYEVVWMESDGKRAGRRIGIERGQYVLVPFFGDGAREKAYRASVSILDGDVGVKKVEMDSPPAFDAFDSIGVFRSAVLGVESTTEQLYFGIEFDSTVYSEGNKSVYPLPILFDESSEPDGASRYSFIWDMCRETNDAFIKITIRQASTCVFSRCYRVVDSIVVRPGDLMGVEKESRFWILGIDFGVEERLKIVVRYDSL